MTFDFKVADDDRSIEAKIHAYTVMLEAVSDRYHALAMKIVHSAITIDTSGNSTPNKDTTNTLPLVYFMNYTNVPQSQMVLDDLAVACIRKMGFNITSDEFPAVSLFHSKTINTPDGKQLAIPVRLQEAGITCAVLPGNDRSNQAMQLLDQLYSQSWRLVATYNATYGKLIRANSQRKATLRADDNELLPSPKTMCFTSQTKVFPVYGMSAQSAVNPTYSSSGNLHAGDYIGSILLFNGWPKDKNIYLDFVRQVNAVFKQHGVLLLSQLYAGTVILKKRPTPRARHASENRAWAFNDDASYAFVFVVGAPYIGGRIFNVATGIGVHVSQLSSPTERPTALKRLGIDTKV